MPILSPALGATVPASPHATVVCLPTLADVAVTLPIAMPDIVQAIARDVLYYVLQKLKHLELLFHVHDEAVANSRKGGADLRHALEVMSTPIPWAPGLPLAGDGHVLEFYQKKD